jgi:PleD family two-component response regulator
VLFAGPEEHAGVALLSKVLETEFTLTRVTTGASALEAASNLRPDLVLLDTGLADLAAPLVSQSLLAEHRVATTTPVLFLAPAPPTFEQRLALVRAGARDSIGLWLSPGDVGRLCRAYVEAKHEIDQGGTEQLFDAVTGLYSWQGLVRRARELGALAARQRQGLACVIFAIDLPPAAQSHYATAASRSAQGVRQTVRLSDTVGSPGNAEFAVLAPATDAAGAVGLAVRLARPARAAAAREIGLEPDDVMVRAGFAAVTNLAYKPEDPATLLLRAGAALYTGQPTPQHTWLRAFVEQPRP